MFVLFILNNNGFFYCFSPSFSVLKPLLLCPFTYFLCKAAGHLTLVAPRAALQCRWQASAVLLRRLPAPVLGRCPDTCAPSAPLHLSEMPMEICW